MGLTNAERQRRWRERQKEKINGAASRNTMAALLAAQYRALNETQPEDFPLDDMRDYVAGKVVAMLGAAEVYVIDYNRPEHYGEPFTLDPENQAIVDMLGGQDYCVAAKRWQKESDEASRTNNRRKEENMVPVPDAPDIPAT